MIQVAEQVRERPILFSSPMIRALLDGRKTQTRRIVKPQPIDIICPRPGHRDTMTRFHGGRRCWAAKYNAIGESGGGKMIYSRLGEVGEHLWVRETFAPCLGGAEGPMNPTLYKSDAKDGYEKLNWKPSIHMPRWASRITLQIDAVRVERLNDISEMDAGAEGIYEVRRCITDGPTGYGKSGTDPQRSFPTRVRAFHALWETIHGIKSWHENPWVWVISFYRVTKEPSHA